MPNKYLDYPFVVDARDLMQNAFNYLKAKITGWQPSEGQLDVWVIEATAGEAADIGSLVSQVPKALFRYLGTLYGVLPLNSASAVTTSTWTLSDTLGHTIFAGTQVSIPDAAGRPQAFSVLSDVIVPTGSNTTSAGQVILVAVTPGSGANGIGSVGGVVSLLDTLAWVTSITQVDVTSGGVDAESDDSYLNRLSLELQTVSPRPILPRDFAILAQNVSGVQRAVAIDGYNPADGSTNNERMITLFALDVDGAPINIAEKTALDAYMESMREINFIVNVADPTINTIDVNVAFTTRSGYDVTTVEGYVTDTINDFLDPSLWGVDQQGDDSASPTTWTNIASVDYLELATAINNTPGVDRVTLLQLAIHGNTLASADVVLTGTVPIPAPGTITVTGT